MQNFDIKEISRRMDGGVKAFQEELSGLRAGRASPAMLDGVTCEVYGTHMPLNQLATVSAPETRLLSIQVWDKANVKAVEKGIANSGLGLNPQTEGQSIRVFLPELSEERRKDLAKVAHKYAEAARVAVRNVRRDGMEAIKAAQKAGMPEDEAKRNSDKVQAETDKHTAQVEDLLKAKEKEIMQL
jgi:ribosome recycling factor